MKKIEKKQYIKFAIAAVLYGLFILWMQNGWLALGYILLADIYLTKYIPWGAWKKTNNPTLKSIYDWIDDIIFALVAVYFINLFIFQNYQIPSSSLEKSLLVGDYLFVSKVSYGPRVPNTPLSFPLVQNTLPIFNCKSYLDWPSWDYKRVAGLGQIQRNDIVVFNFPAGDTVATLQQNPDYYTLVQMYGREAVRMNKQSFGEIIYRPVDKRENYVKRCVGLPGDSLSIRNNQVYINGKAAQNPKNMQLNYFVETETPLTETMFRNWGVSRDDYMPYGQPCTVTDPETLSFLGFQPNANGAYNLVYRFPMTEAMVAQVKKLPSVKKVIVEPEIIGGTMYYPVDYDNGWTRDNYGPIWIPKRGATIELTPENLALYRRCIKNYEHNELEEKDGAVYINGEKATTYTFQYDYYWMMGDNRHNSADSRSWGFVPEDHIVGKPIMIWLSLDKDRSLFDGGIRWNRLFRWVDSMK
ncbi:signal peptidase I [Parabacteroides sp. AGMB00274]|uniref:Signal peptidase I n=1 Tax=Parabacteroides faecalis TaxID=2924040 RepID=A0ABT0C1F4_9BACT|nr:signal peptidase I [Parabacteroides faecalis]MBS7341740.1 signal peptidase I [Parabacteroides sp.]MCJ2380829.1 signal peptidase I [Parabacteroides faecalis]